MADFVKKNIRESEIASPLGPGYVAWTGRHDSINDDLDPRLIASPGWMISAKRHPTPVSPSATSLAGISGR
jgi:hypothetical protein